MRKDDPEGDYGRQRRQRQVTELLAKELLSLSSLFQYQELMSIVGENGQTDLTFQQISRLITSYQSTLTTVDLYQIQGQALREMDCKEKQGFLTKQSLMRNDS